MKNSFNTCVPVIEITVDMKFENSNSVYSLFEFKRKRKKQHR